MKPISLIPISQKHWRWWEATENLWLSSDVELKRWDMVIHLSGFDLKEMVHIHIPSQGPDTHFVPRVLWEDFILRGHLKYLPHLTKVEVEVDMDVKEELR